MYITLHNNSVGCTRKQYEHVRCNEQISAALCPSKSNTVTEFQ